MTGMLLDIHSGHADRVKVIDFYRRAVLRRPCRAAMRRLRSGGGRTPD